MQLHQDIFLGIAPLWILHCGVHLAENSKVVETRLRIQQVLLAQRIAWADLKFAIHNIASRVFRPGNHDLIDRETLAFLNRKTHILPIGLAGGRLSCDLQRGIGKSMVEVVRQNSLAVVRQCLLGIGLARLCAKFR